MAQPPLLLQLRYPPRFAPFEHRFAPAVFLSPGTVFLDPAFSNPNWWISVGRLCAMWQAGSGNALAFTDTAKSAGYSETTVLAVGTGTMGVGFSASSGGRPANDDYVHDGGIGFLSDGRVSFQNFSGGSFNGTAWPAPPFVVGRLVRNGKAYFHLNNVYQGAGGTPADPVAETGGVDISTIGPSFLPTLFTNGTGAQVIENYGATPFVYAIPVGPSWDGSRSASSTTYNDNLSESAVAADSLSPAGSTFAVPLTESAATGDSTAATQGFVNTLAESAAAADNVAGGLLLSGSLNEATAAADALATAVTFASADAESAAAADSINPAGSIFGVPLAESAAAADALGVGLAMPVSASESAAAADAVASSQTFVNALGESAAAADSLSAGLVIVKLLNESAAAADAATVAVTFGPALSESAAAGDAEASQAVMPNALGEQASAGDSAASAQVFTESLGESAGAGDSVSAGATTYNEAVNENLAALASLGVGLVLPVAVGETAAAADATGAAADLAATLGEAAVANDDFVGALTSLYPPGPVDPARIGVVDRQSGTAAIAASSRSEAVVEIRRNGRVAASARIGIVNRAPGRVG